VFASVVLCVATMQFGDLFVSVFVVKLSVCFVGSLITTLCTFLVSTITVCQLILFCGVLSVCHFVHIILLFYMHVVGLRDVVFALCMLCLMGNVLRGVPSMCMWKY
jgi:hypothetical protein